MNKKQTHTRLPWYRGEFDEKMIAYWILSDHDLGLFAPVLPAIAFAAGRTKKEAKANADFIIKACNTYYEREGK